MIKLGALVQDKVSGFKGIATARCEYINGCVEYCISPKSDGATIPDSVYIDDKRLSIIGEGIQIEHDNTGGATT